MCGICGRVAVSLDRNDAARLVSLMSERLRHRGPDDSGLWSDAHAALGHRRLSIIDLSPAGHQPMISEDGRFVLIFNGEIYNYQQLRRQFQNDISFRYNNDTEVILQLYARLGPACLQHLRGMFALAIWDTRNRSLFLARDRAGKKPLFYSLHNGVLIFSSELHALLVHPEFEFAADERAISHYLSLQYIPSPLTIYKNVCKLPPAHFALFQNGKLTVERYWQLEYAPSMRSEEEALEELKEVFTESVKLRMISDVPLGAFLSGGIDSSAVVSMMSELSDIPVKTFSIRFEEETYNEAGFAAQVAAHCRADHHEFCVKPNYIEILPELIRHFGEPFADSSALPVYYLSKMTREQVTVALTGDGGDEAFGGYGRYLNAEPEKKFAAVLASPVKNMFPPNMRYLWRIRRAIDNGTESVAADYMHRICYFRESEKSDLFTPEFADKATPADSLEWFEQQFARFAGVPYPQNLMAVDNETYLPDDVLVKSDIATMTCSLEARSPFLDHKLMEFAASLPVHMKIQNGATKYLLKKYLAPRLPAEIIHRPKMGFGTPITVWFRQSLSGYVRDVLLSPEAMSRGYFQRGAVEKLIQRHQSGWYDCGYQLYALLVLELWHRQFPGVAGKAE